MLQNIIGQLEVRFQSFEEESFNAMMIAEHRHWDYMNTEYAMENIRTQPEQFQSCQEYDNPCND